MERKVSETKSKGFNCRSFIDTGVPVTRHHPSVLVEVDVVGVWARNLVAVLSMTQPQQSVSRSGYLDEEVRTTMGMNESR